MAALSTTHTFEGSIVDVFQGIRQFDSYPEHLPGVSAIKVLPAKKPGSTCQVRFELHLIKSFHYTLNMYEEAPQKLWWDLDSSNIMKKSTGSWELKSLGAKSTEALYTVDIAFSALVPQKIVDKITAANLGNMMEGFQIIINKIAS